jgi:hypothetical protein
MAFSIFDTSMKAFWIECHYAECHDLFIVMLNVHMQIVVMLNVMAPTHVEHLKCPILISSLLPLAPDIRVT